MFGNTKKGTIIFNNFNMLVLQSPGLAAETGESALWGYKTVLHLEMSGGMDSLDPLPKDSIAVLGVQRLDPSLVGVKGESGYPLYP